jgi:hypothetical protein
MALVLADRVQENTTTSGTGSVTLAGAVFGFQTFAVIGNGNTTYYAATDVSGNWEAGIGTYSTSGPTLTRTTILSSSNSGSAVTFVGTVTVFVTYPSGKSVNLDASGNVSALGTVASGTWNATPVTVAYGGTGLATTVAYSIVFTGTTSTGAFQASAGPGTAGQLLTSNGAGALPTFQTSTAASKSYVQAIAIMRGL